MNLVPLKFTQLIKSTMNIFMDILVTINQWWTVSNYLYFLLYLSTFVKFLYFIRVFFQKRKKERKKERKKGKKISRQIEIQ